MNLDHYIRSVESRILGRVFSYDGQLHFVVGVDETSGLARCTRRGRRGVDEILMPVAEITLRLGWEQERQEQELISKLSDDQVRPAE